MGRFKRRGNRGGGKQRGHGEKSAPRTQVWEDTLTASNDRLEIYYRRQKIVEGDEWDAYMNALRQPLPSTFRIAGNRDTVQMLSEIVKNTFVPQLQSIITEGTPLAPVSWYPEGLAWQISVPRKSISKSPDYKRFHNFLVFETDTGNITRQEAVSMLPPLFLDVRPHHHVIDMCAAPGSKTSQILEAMHESSSTAPTGVLIANDSDNKRSHLLVHQLARIPSPVVMVTNLDASIYPSIEYNPLQTDDKEVSSSGKLGRSRQKPNQLLFDRILCDVPCSGDGTIRKNIGIWKSWAPAEGNGLHSLQLRILQRAMKLLKRNADPDDWPRIVYSTCSMNPIENEAVIAAALNSMPGYELVDVSEQLPTLIRRPGLDHWQPVVLDENKEMIFSFASYEEYSASMPDEPEPEPVEDEKTNSKNRLKQRPKKPKVFSTFWPPVNVKDLHLERCLRIYPHLQNTGGFFVAVLQRRKPKPRAEPLKRKVEDTDSAELNVKKLKAEGTTAAPEPVVEAPGGAPPSAGDLVEDQNTVIQNSDGKPEDDLEPPEKLPVTGGLFKENPYTFLKPDDPFVQACMTRLKVKPNFPAGNLYVRNPSGEAIRSLYLVNDTVKALIKSTDYSKIRLVSAGVKVFGKAEGASVAARDGSSIPPFRFLSEGLGAVLSYVPPEEIIQADISALNVFLRSYFPLCTSFPEPFKALISEKPVGSFVICFKPSQIEGASLTHDLTLPLWRSDQSVSLMIDKRAKSALSLRLWGKDITVAGQSAQVKDETAPTATEESEAKEKDSDVAMLQEDDNMIQDEVLKAENIESDDKAS